MCFNLEYLTNCYAIFYLECPNNTITRNSQLLYLSTQPSTYDEAENICQLVGGNVASITENDYKYIWPYFNKTMLKGNSINVDAFEASFNKRILYF